MDAYASFDLKSRVKPTAGVVPKPDLPAVTVAGQGVNLFTEGDVLQAVHDLLAAQTSFRLYTLNLDHAVKLRQSADFREAYAGAELITADGAPIVHLARKAGAHVERVAGSDLIVPLCQLAAQQGWPVYVFGSRQQVLETAMGQLKAVAPGLQVAGLEAPAMGFDPNGEAAADAIDRIAGSGARLCFLALGAPKQELFAAHAARHPASAEASVGYLCIGAGLDFIAGDVQRAPKWMQTAGLEWLWRLSSEPKRLFWRYAQCAWEFGRLLRGQ